MSRLYVERTGLNFNDSTQNRHLFNGKIFDCLQCPNPLNCCRCGQWSVPASKRLRSGSFNTKANGSPRSKGGRPYRSCSQLADVTETPSLKSASIRAFAIVNRLWCYVLYSGTIVRVRIAVTYAVPYTDGVRRRAAGTLLQFASDHATCPLRNDM